MRFESQRGGTPHGVLLRTTVLRKIFLTENVPYRIVGDGEAGYRSDVRVISKTQHFSHISFVAEGNKKEMGSQGIEERSDEETSAFEMVLNMGDSHNVRFVNQRSGTPHGVLLRTTVLRKIFLKENFPYRLVETVR